MFPSLPAWERGLKREPMVCVVLLPPSLPAWERGLKHLGRRGIATELKSLPAWERGLKHAIVHIDANGYDVAPRVGAWIETLPIRIAKR